MVTEAQVLSSRISILMQHDREVCSGHRASQLSEAVAHGKSAGGVRAALSTIIDVQKYRAEEVRAAVRELEDKLAKKCIALPET